jgi:hypothetical protein
MDVVTGTIDSAERVAALRADKGKDLSQVNRESLDELKQSMERLDALLEAEDEAAPTPPESGEDDLTDAVQKEFLRYAATTP